MVRSMKKLEWLLCALLALAGLGHLLGTFMFYEPGTELFAWSLAAAAFVFMLVFLHGVRIVRPHDSPIAWGAIVGTVAWIVCALLFGAADTGVLDPRVLMHVLVSAALVVTALLGMRTASRTAVA